MTDFTLYPALDVRGGRVVRLRQGDYGAETDYGDDPLARAELYAAEGARWLHLVDLEAAREGGYSLVALLAAIKQRTTLRVQTGGGVRTAADVARLLDAGADRVVIGSLSVLDPGRVAKWLDRFGAERIAVALDTRRDEAGVWSLPVEGWTEPSSRTLGELAGLFASSGMRHLLCTDIDRDGILSGPNLGLYTWLKEKIPGVALQASGGVRDASDVAATRAVGCEGVVLGRALLERRLTLSDLYRETTGTISGLGARSC